MLILNFHYAGYCEELTAVSGFCVQEDAAGVELVELIPTELGQQCRPNYLVPERRE